jgi:transcriptional regulator with XRE-family HTH domain
MLTLEQILDLAKGDGDYQTLAKRLGCHKAAVSKWRHGLGAPDPEYIPELARLSGLSVAAVAIAALATRDRRGVKARQWTQAWDQLARAGLAAAAGVAVVSDCILCKAPTAQEAPTPAIRWLRQLSGWLKNHQPALQDSTARTLRRLCAWPRGYSTSSPASPGASWLTPAWAPA